MASKSSTEFAGLAGSAAGAWPPLLYVGIGTKETDDLEILAKGSGAIERFVAAAKGAGVRVVLSPVEGATHNSAAWRARFPTAMRALYGAQLTVPDLGN